jgi:signal transduction histidine kinase
MPLDSGTLATLRSWDRSRLALQSALAIQFNTPLTLIRLNSEATRLPTSITPPPLEYHAVSVDTSARCQQLLHSWPQWKKHFRELARTNFALPPSYANPGVRLLRDNWAWSWSEVIEIFNQIDLLEPDGRPRLFNSVYSKHLWSYLCQLDDNFSMLLGPVLVRPQENLTDWDFEALLRSEIDDFNSAVLRAWGSLPNRERIEWPSDVEIRSAVYGTDYIIRMLYGRGFSSPAKLATSGSHISSAYRIAQQFFDGSDQQYRPDAVARFVAGLASTLLQRDGPNAIHFTARLPTIRNGGIVEEDFEFLTSNDRTAALSSKKILKSSDERSRPNDNVTEAPFVAKTAFYYETFVLLRNYLNRKFGVYVAPEHTIQLGIPTKVGDRIIRLIARLFEADEAAVYRVEYKDAHKPLSRYGSYTEYVEPNSRGNIMLEHMRTIGVNEYDRSGSISYRAIDEQRTQVCESFDRDRKVAVPAKQLLSCPDTEHRWGSSGCSAPIVINGRTWGAVELISDRPWNFPLDSVKKIEEVCSIVGPSFYYQGILSSLSEIYQTIANPQIPFKQKLNRVCQQLPDLFLGESAAIYFRRQDGTFYPAACHFRSDVVGFLNDDAEESRSTKSLECSILENISAIQEFAIGEAPFDLNFFNLSKNSFFQSRSGCKLLAIPLLESQLDAPTARVFGLITLVLGSRRNPDLTSSSEEVSNAHDFLRGYLTVALQLIYASYVWERSTRSYLSHEVTRLAIEFEARLYRARDAANKIAATGLDETQRPLRFRLLQSLSDLSANLTDLQHFNDIFKSVSAVGKSDPLLAAARALRDEETSSEVITLRDIVNEIFLSRQTLSAKSQIRMMNSVQPSHRIRMNRRNLREVLGNLAENAIKYADARSIIETSSHQSLRGEISLLISNAGPRLTPEEKRRLFEEGFRAQYAHDKNIPGLGRGLGYARDIVRLYHGEITYRLHSRDKAVRAAAESFWHEVEIRFPAEMTFGDKA